MIPHWEYIFAVLLFISLFTFTSLSFSNYLTTQESYLAQEDIRVKVEEVADNLILWLTKSEGEGDIYTPFYMSREHGGLVFVSSTKLSEMSNTSELPPEVLAKIINVDLKKYGYEIYVRPAIDILSVTTGYVTIEVHGGGHDEFEVPAVFDISTQLLNGEPIPNVKLTVHYYFMPIHVAGQSGNFQAEVYHFVKETSTDVKGEVTVDFSGDLNNVSFPPQADGWDLVLIIFGEKGSMVFHQYFTFGNASYIDPGVLGQLPGKSRMILSPPGFSNCKAKGLGIKEGHLVVTSFLPTNPFRTGFGIPGIRSEKAYRTVIAWGEAYLIELTLWKVSE